MEGTDATFISNVTSRTCYNNDTCGVDLRSNMAPFNELVLRVTYIVIGSVGFLDNLVVIIVIFNYTSMRKKLTNNFIINQSLIDAVVSFFVLFLGIFEVDGHNLTKGNIRDELICSLWLSRAPLWSMLMSSTYNLVGLTVERYFEVVHPIAHKLRFTKKKAVIGMVCAWVIGPLYNLAYEVPTSAIVNGVCYPFSIWPSKLNQSLVGVLTVLLQYILPIAIMTYCYAKIAVTLRARIQPMSQMANTMSRARRNVIKTLVIVCICFVLCWTWNEVFIFLYFIGYPTNFGSSFYHFTVMAVFCNSCVNPFIYIIKYEEFQVGLKRLLCGLGRGHADVANGSLSVSTTANTHNQPRNEQRIATLSC